MSSDEFEVLQEWEGEVCECTEEKFTAVLRDLTNPNNPNEVVTLPKSEVSEADRETR